MPPTTREESMATKTVTIEVECPTGWEPVAFRKATPGESYISDNGSLMFGGTFQPSYPRLVIRKKPPVARPYNAAEMESLVGKVLLFSEGGRHLVTDFSPEDGGTVCITGEWEYAEVLKENYTHLDGTRCEVIE